MRVAVGMSGGVDSSVAALLLKEKGQDVIGVTLRFHTLEACEVDETHNVCCSPKDVKDAVQVSRALGIPHLTFDWEKIFKDRVINYFIGEYSRGRTPNPCAMCNREVKTGFFARYLKEVAEIDRLATGHYARIETDERLGRVIKRGKDRKRDQSYFLALVRREDLNLLEFPLGSMTKEEVRSLAMRRGLPVARKRDSQEVCFLMGKSPGEYMESILGRREGVIKHVSGEVVGKHTGVYNFTVGQRRGLGISWKRPLYVLRLDADTNTVVVGEGEYLYKDTVCVELINELVPMEKWSGEILAQIRYRHAPVRVEDIKESSGTWIVKLKKPVRGVAPGQVIAFYMGDILLGGGIMRGSE